MTTTLAYVFFSGKSTLVELRAYSFLCSQDYSDRFGGPDGVLVIEPGPVAYKCPTPLYLLLSSESCSSLRSGLGPGRWHKGLESQALQVWGPWLCMVPWVLLERALRSPIPHKTQDMKMESDWWYAVPVLEHMPCISEVWVLSLALCTPSFSYLVAPQTLQEWPFTKEEASWRDGELTISSLAVLNGYSGRIFID